MPVPTVIDRTGGKLAGSKLEEVENPLPASQSLSGAYRAD
jgi:hypothetical protein